jgi:hypothetical protein
MITLKEVSKFGTIFILIVVLGISAAGIYFGYSLSIHSVTQSEKLTLRDFSLNPIMSNLTGTIGVQSNSPLIRMALYLNDTYMGSLNYSNHYVMMSTMMGNDYSYSYSMKYSAYPGTMPMMSKIRMMQNQTYIVTMMATFGDGSTCNASTVIRR